MAPLIKIFTSLLPYPSFLRPTLPIPPSSSESSPSPFSLPISPYIHSLHPRAPKICLAILFTSNIQEDNNMIFFGFTFLFSFSGITNYRLNVLLWWLESTYEWVHTIFLFLGSGLPHSVKRFLFPSISMQNSRCHCFLLLSKTPLCICFTPSLTILLLRGT